MPFTFTPTAQLPEVVLIEPKIRGDSRGWFAETYKRSEFAAAGITPEFHQDNQSLSTGRGILRGLHYQLEPVTQGKLVRALRGEVFDVAVDIRRGSPTYGRWAGATLTAENHAMLWVPPGFAHGFQTLTELTEVAYKTTGEYSPAHEGAVRWNDPALAISWPVADAKLNERDAGAPLLADARNTFSWKAP